MKTLCSGDYWYGMPFEEVRKLRRAIDLYATQQTHVCNGDPHSMNPNPSDKNRNAELWDQASEMTANKIKYIAKKYGFDGVDFGVGLYPVLMKGDEKCIMVPE